MNKTAWLSKSESKYKRIVPNYSFPCTTIKPMICVTILFTTAVENVLKTTQKPKTLKDVVEL